MNRIFTILLAALIALAPAFAEKGHRQRKGAKSGACKADMERLCGAHKGDKKATRACMKANADLIDTLRAAARTHQVEVRQVRGHQAPLDTWPHER